MRFTLSQIVGALLVASGIAAALPAEIKHRGTTHNIIPVTQVGCYNQELDACAIEEAMEKAIAYGEKFVVPRRSLKYWNDANHTVAWWICNCKLERGDPITRDELQEVLGILEEKCGGRYQGGWVWSQEWKKAINLGSASGPEGVGAVNACPPHCYEAGNTYGIS